MAKSRTTPQRLGFKESVRQQLAFQRKIQKMIDESKLSKPEIVDFAPIEEAGAELNEADQ